MDIQPCSYSTNHWIVNLKWVNFLTCESHPKWKNKPDYINTLILCNDFLFTCQWPAVYVAVTSQTASLSSALLRSAPHPPAAPVCVCISSRMPLSKHRGSFLVSWCFPRPAFSKWHTLLLCVLPSLSSFRKLYIFYLFYYLCRIFSSSFFFFR